MKKRLKPSNTLVAIDVGTTKICVLIAQKTVAGHCDIIGIGRAPSQGLSRGVVVDVAPAVNAIKGAVQEAELMAGCSIESAYIGISGAHIAAHHSSGMVPIKNGIIREHDIERVVNTARTIPLPEDEQILHAVPQQFTIDGKHVVRDPLSMHGVRLECRAHIITGNITLVKNLIQCCEVAGVKVRDVILEPIASAEAVLSQDERELGVALLDIGGGTSDFAIYQRGTIRHAKIFPIAGNLFTNDIALCMRTTREEAERLKKEFGHTNNPIENTTYLVQSIDGCTQHEIRLHDLAVILSARTQELLVGVKHELDTFNATSFSPSGLVITGGGSLLFGLTDHATQLLGLPARIGNTRALGSFKDELNHPRYATAYGLLLHTLRTEADLLKAQGSGPLTSRLFWRMKSWIADLF